MFAYDIVGHQLLANFKWKCGVRFGPLNVQQCCRVQNDPKLANGIYLKGNGFCSKGRHILQSAISLLPGFGLC